MSPSTRVVIVTGAAGNVGAAIAHRLGAAGAALALVDQSEAALARLTASLGAQDRHMAMAGLDLRDPAQCRKLAEDVVAQRGRIDALVNTVGGFDMAPIEDAGDELWDRMLAINLRTTVNMIRAVVPAMKRQQAGRIVSIAAGAALKAPAQLAAYAAAKAGVIKLTESVADELKGQGITANAVLPGTIDTPQNRAAMPDADVTKWVSPDEVAAVLAFLVSEEAGGVNGAAIPVTGRG